MRFSILCIATDSSDKAQLMCSTIMLCLFASKYDINGSRLNYSTCVSSNKFKYIKTVCTHLQGQSVISVALKTPLEIRLGICIYKTSLLHRPDDYLGFTPSCPPHFTTKLRPCLLQHYCGVGRQFLNWSSLGKMRKHCGMTRHQSNG